MILSSCERWRASISKALPKYSKQQLVSANLKNSAGSNRFSKEVLESLGDIFSKGGVGTNPTKIVDIPSSKTLKKLYPFLDMSLYYCDYTKPAKPLTSFLRREDDLV